MRQIIFRGKSLYNNEWVYGDLVHISGGTIIITSQEEGPVLPDNCDHALEYRVDEFAPVDPETVGQWTGLIDSKGVRIFDGDIMTNKHIYPDLKYVVCYNEELASFVLKVPSDIQVNGMLLSGATISFFERAVVGNIFDNKDFLDDE